MHHRKNTKDKTSERIEFMITAVRALEVTVCSSCTHPWWDESGAENNETFTINDPVVGTYSWDQVTGCQEHFFLSSEI